MQQPSILFQNQDFLVAHKPPLFLSVPSRHASTDDRPCLGHWLEEKVGRLWPIHRLDFEVSGLLLWARNAPAHRLASLAFEHRQVQKTYQAWTAHEAQCTFSCSDPKPWSHYSTTQIWESTLLKGKKRAYEHPRGKKSLTEVCCQGPPSAPSHHLSWRLHPLTGRSHQLRYEMSRHGYPILGDVLYGSQTPWPSGGIALEAVELNFSRCPELLALGLPREINQSAL